MEKMGESINKDLEELKNKHTKQTTQLQKIKILQKESIAEYLKQKNKSVSWKINGGTQKLFSMEKSVEGKIKQWKRRDSP